MKLRMKKLLSLALAGAMVFSMAACGGSSDSANDSSGGSGNAAESAASVQGNTSEPQYGGEATLYYPKFYDFWDPAMINEYQYSFWYETLFVIDWGLNDTSTYAFGASTVPVEYMAGQIAEDTGTFDADAGTVTVKLRDDVYFQDGDPYNGRQLVADDVVFSYSRLLGLNGYEKFVAADNPMIDWDSNLYMLEGVEATDDQTVVFTLKSDYANEVGYQAFVNQKVNIVGTEWGDLSEDEQADWHYAKGTGPYIITAYEADNSMTLEKNENYYDYDERYPDNKLPYIDKITLVYIADSSNILSQAMSGKLDWFGENGKNVLTTEQLSQLTEANTGYNYVYNSSSPVAIGLKTSQAPFDDENVRIAMQHAIDLPGISQAFLGISADEVIVPGLWSPDLTAWTTIGTWDADTLAEYDYDPELAKQMLEEAGYPDGFEFTIQLDPTANQEIFTEAKAELAQVGITMNIETAAEMMEAVQTSQDPDDERQYNTNYGGFPNYNLANMMIGDSSARLEVETNSYNHHNQEVFDLLASMQTATTIADQSDMAQQLDTIFAGEHWGIMLTGVQPCTDWMSSRIGGYSGEKVYFDQNMRTIWSRLWIDQGASGSASE